MAQYAAVLTTPGEIAEGIEADRLTLSSSPAALENVKNEAVQGPLENSI